MQNIDNSSIKITRIIHWSFALFIITMLSVGFYMKNTAYNPDIYQLHKMFGVLFCLLIVGRILWRINNPWQSSSLNTKQESLVHWMHITLIILMVLMPVTGFLISAFSGFGIHIIGFFIVPEFFNASGEITPLHDGIYQTAKLLHEIFAYCFSLLIFGHISAALKHHFIDKDNTLIRMFKAD